MKGYNVLDENIVVCLGLDVAPTAYGQFLLACVMERAMQIHNAEDDHNPLVLFTLGAGGHRYPTIEPFKSPIVIDFGIQIKIPEPVLVCNSDSLNVYIVDLTMRLKKSGQGLVLSFLYDPEPRSTLRTEMHKAFFFLRMPIPLRVINLHPAYIEDPSLVEELLSVKGYALIQVDPSITACLPFRHVHAIFYSRESKTQVLDGYTGLYLWKTKRMSGPAVDVFRSYTVHLWAVERPHGHCLPAAASVGPPPQPRHFRPPGDLLGA